MMMHYFIWCLGRWVPAFAGMTGLGGRGMMKLLLLVCLLYLPTFSHATSWPIFKSPTLKFLQDNDLIDTANCPAGEGRIPPDLVLNIQRYFCGRFCPGGW